ncbi:MAG: LysR family transcriptional regulator [Paracoccaceae bacterium]|nr:LysR family transcriptional regulator [Paracoccaceae bacterium]
MNRYTLRQLEYLVACIDQRSIAKAANIMNVSQPTISVAISKLERQFGVQLLLRHHSQGVSPTSSATKILTSARNLLAHATDLQRAAMLAGTDVVGDLRIGSFSTLAPLVLPGLIQFYSAQYPDVTLHIEEGTEDSLLVKLYDGKLDSVLLYDVALPEDLRRVKLAERMPYVVLPFDHPLAEFPSVSLAQLHKEPFILLDVAPSRRFFLGLFAAAGLIPNIAHTSPTLELVRGMVGHGLGYSILVTRPHGDMTYDGRKLAIRPLQDADVTSLIVLASLADIRPTRLTASFEIVAVNFIA